MRRIALMGLASLIAVSATLSAQDAPPPSPAALPPPLTDPAQVLAAFAPGPGRETAARACGICHAPVMITVKHYTDQKWADVVDHMIDKGAQVPDKDYDTIISYLSQHYGPAS